MPKHKILDEYWNDLLSFIMFHIGMHSIIKIHTHDINTNKFGASILLVIVKLKHKHRKNLKNICHQLVLGCARNMVGYMNYLIQESKPLNLIRNSILPITSIQTKINLFLQISITPEPRDVSTGEVLNLPAGERGTVSVRDRRRGILQCQLPMDSK